MQTANSRERSKGDGSNTDLRKYERYQRKSASICGLFFLCVPRGLLWLLRIFPLLFAPLRLCVRFFSSQSCSSNQVRISFRAIVSKCGKRAESRASTLRVSSTLNQRASASSLPTTISVVTASAKKPSIKDCGKGQG